MPLRVLVVDDSPITRFLIKEMLEANGHLVVAEAENLAQTLAAYKTHKPDVVTLDLSLVSEDGLSLLRALRRLDGRAQVLVISGNVQSEVQDEVRAAGAAGYLDKPFAEKDLIEAIARLSPG